MATSMARELLRFLQTIADLIDDFIDALYDDDSYDALYDAWYDAWYCAWYDALNGAWYDALNDLIKNLIDALYGVLYDALNDALNGELIDDLINYLIEDLTDALYDALSSARKDYSSSKNIKNSKKLAFRSSYVTKSDNTRGFETANTKKQLEVRQSVASSNDRESEKCHIQIFISTPVKTLCLQLHPSTAISDLKELLEEKLNIHAKNQHLVTKRGIELCDTQSLMVLGIQQDTCLQLRQVAGLMGGARKRKSGGGQGKTIKKAKTQDEQETKNSSESKQEDVTESMGTYSTVDGIPGTSTSAVQSQRTSSSTGAIPKNPSKTKEKVKLQDQEELATQQRASTEKQDCLVQSQRTLTGTGAIPKNSREKKEQMKSTKTKPHQSASAPLQEEPRPHQSVSSAAGNINKITSNIGGKDIVPASQQDLAMISQTPDARTVCHHHSHSQATVQSMSVAERSAVFNASASGTTINHNYVNAALSTGMPQPNHQAQAQAIADVTKEILKQVNTVTGMPHPSHKAIADVTKEVLKQVNTTTGTPDPDYQAQPDVNEAKEALKKVYQDTGSYVQMLPWVDDDKIHIMDIYTKLILVELGDKVGKTEKDKKPLKSYEDIFHLKTREGNPIKRIVFSGSAGLGKTTLIDKIAYDWAMGKSEILKRFELVFVLKMRALEQTSELIDAIFEQLLDHDSINNADDLKKFIDKNQDKVLILLDGFDEFQTTTLNKSSFGSTLKTLNRKQCKECWVVVTSRPPLHKLVSSSLVEKPFTHVNIVGFSEQDIKEYINKFFPEDHDQVKKLVEKIQSSEVLSDLAKSPMLLLLMCLLWREPRKLPDTMTRLYTEALKYIFKRKAKDLSQDAISQILISIGKVGLHGLISTKQSLSFTEKDFDKKTFDAAIRTGVLTSERGFKGLDIHNNVYFIHKTFLEFCAAMYWQSLINTKEFKQILVRVCSATSTYPSPYEYLLRFCCGDNKECTNQVLRILQENLDPRLGLICYFESQSKSLSSENFIEAVVGTEIKISGWNNACMNSFFYLLKNIADQTKLKDCAYLSCVNHLSIEFCDLGRFCSELADCFTNMTNISILSLILNTTLGGCASLWAPPLKRMKHLKNLELLNCNLIGEDMAPIAESLSDMPTLSELDLSGNDTLGGCASLWAIPLKRMQHLKNLALLGCHLIGEDMAPIAESLSDMPTLGELDLSLSDALGGCASLWAIPLKRMKHLKKLRLAGCKLIGEDMAPIAESLSDMPSLSFLDLSLNDALGGCASLWAPPLKRMKHVKKLGLVDCKLIPEDMALILKSKSDMPNLREVNLCSHLVNLCKKMACPRQSCNRNTFFWE